MGPLAAVLALRLCVDGEDEWWCWLCPGWEDAWPLWLLGFGAVLGLLAALLALVLFGLEWLRPEHARHGLARPLWLLGFGTALGLLAALLVLCRSP